MNSIPTSTPRLTRHFVAPLLALLLCVLALSPFAAFAQSSNGNGQIDGRVQDSTGAVVPHATVTITNINTSAKRVLQTDGAGYYLAPSLQVGTYNIEATAANFATDRIEGVTLNVGDTIAINLRLAAAGVNTVVEVSSEPDDTHKTEIGNSTLIDNNLVENLPTRGRNFTDFALLSPGISQEGDRFGLVINGQRSSNLNISIDGADFNDPLQGGQRGGNDSVYFFPQSAVQEFQVVRTGTPASVGRTNGGFVNVVTKSGTNRLHGEALYTNRNPALTWPSPFNTPNTDNVQNQFGGDVGGPILRDKAFFLISIEKNLLQTPYYVYALSGVTQNNFCDPTLTVAVVPASQVPCSSPAGANLTPLPASITSQEGSFFGVNNPLASFGRVDYHLNRSNTLTATYTSTFLSGLAFGSTATQNSTTSDNTNLARQSQGFTLGVTTILSANKTNEAKLQYAYDNRQQVPVSPAAEIDISDTITTGGASGGTYIYRAIREEALDNFTWLLGRHTLAFGFDINLEPETQQREANANGDWAINTLVDYINALPVAQGGKGMTEQQVNGNPPGNPPEIVFTQTLPASGGAELKYRGTQRELAGYIQDNWQALPRLTLNLGFRYEAQLEPQPSSVNPAYPQTGVNVDDVTQFQPRVGLSYDVFGKGKTIFRASSGLYDAHTPAYLLQRNFTDNGLLDDNLNSTYDPTLFNGIPFLGTYTTVPKANIINDVYTNTLRFRNPRSVQVAVGIEQELYRRTTVVVNFVQNESYDLQHRLNTNLFQPTVNAQTLYPVFPSINPVTGVKCVAFATTAPVPCRPDPTIGAFNQNFSTAHSTYRGLQISLHTRYKTKAEARINYTWSSARDDDSNERDFNRQLALDPLCTACYNKGYNKQDIRNQGNIAGIYRLPFGFIFGSTLTLRSGLPWNAVLSGKSADYGDDGNTNNDRPILCSLKPFTVCPLNAAGNAATGQVVGRNVFRQPGFLNWDMRMIKQFRIRKGQYLEFSAEGLNVSRGSNLNFGANQESKFTKATTILNASTGYYYTNVSAGFPTSYPATNRPGGPRQIQLGARYIF